MNITIPSAAAALLIAATLVGCSQTSATPASTTSAPAPVVCPNPEGGSCLGEVDAGTYRTTIFQPTIEYTVPAGFTNLEDLPGNFLLERVGDPQDGPAGGNYVGIYQAIRAPEQDCSEQIKPGIGSSADELVSWVETLPQLDATNRAPVTVGGLTGVSIDLHLKDGATGVCTDDDVSFVPIIIGSGVSQVHHVVLAGLTMRLIVLDWNGDNVAVEVTTLDDQISQADYLAEVQPIIDSIAFG